MTLVDSEAAFKQRCAELSTTTLDLHALLTAQNISCFSELAFSCGAPNKAPTDEEFRNFSMQVLGAGSTAGQQFVETDSFRSSYFRPLAAQISGDK